MSVKKMYYKDPLIAAYMARDFGVFTSPKLNTGEVNFDTRYPRRGVYTDQWEILPPLWGEYYIHPDSYSVFEPKDDDKGTDWNDVPCYYDDGHWWTYDGSRVNLLDGKIKSIDKRDGKPFFMPEVESE